MSEEPNSITVAANGLTTGKIRTSMTLNSLLKGCVFLNVGTGKANLKLTTIREWESVMEA